MREARSVALDPRSTSTADGASESERLAAISKAMQAAVKSAKKATPQGATLGFRTILDAMCADDSDELRRRQSEEAEAASTSNWRSRSPSPEERDLDVTIARPSANPPSDTSQLYVPHTALLVGHDGSQNAWHLSPWTHSLLSACLGYLPWAKQGRVLQSQKAQCGSTELGRKRKSDELDDIEAPPRKRVRSVGSQ